MTVSSGNDAIILAYSLLNPAVSLVGGRVYPSHLRTIANPVYPCVTLAIPSGSTRIDGLAWDGMMQLDVWSKKDRDELWAIYLQCRAILNLSVDGWRRCREAFVDDNLYEASTLTYHLASRYKIYI